MIIRETDTYESLVYLAITSLLLLSHFEICGPVPSCLHSSQTTLSVRPSITLSSLAIRQIMHHILWSELGVL